MKLSTSESKFSNWLSTNSGNRVQIFEGHELCIYFRQFDALISLFRHAIMNFCGVNNIDLSANGRRAVNDIVNRIIVRAFYCFNSLHAYNISYIHI